MVILLRVLGWFGLLASGLSGYFKLFGSDEVVRRYIASGRDLDLNISVAAFCLLFLALAAILSELRKMKRDK